MQVTETGEVLVEDETSNSSPGETSTLQLDEPFTAAPKPALTGHPPRPPAHSMAASSSAAAREGSGAACFSEQQSAVDRGEEQKRSPLQGQITPGYGRLIPKSLPTKLPRVRGEEEDLAEHREARVARSEGPQDPSPLKKRRFSDSVVSGGALKATVAQRARAWVDTESMPVLQQLLEDLAEGQQSRSQTSMSRSGAGGPSGAEADDFPELAGIVQDDSALASDRGLPQQGTMGESSTDRSRTDHPSGYRAEQSYVSLSEPWGDGRTPSYPASSQDHTPLDTVSQRFAGSAELSTGRSDFFEPPATASASQPSPRPGVESAINLEPRGAPALPYSPFGSGAQTPTSAQQSPPRSPPNASSSALGSSAQGAQPDSLAPTEITLRHPDDPNEATLFIPGSSGTQISSPHNTTSSGSRNTNTPPVSQGAPQSTRVDAHGLQFSSIHVVWPNELESGSNAGGSTNLASMQSPQGAPSGAASTPVEAATDTGAPGRHLDGDDVDVDPNATFSSDSSWATGATPRHMWTPRTMPERSLSMPDLPPDLEDAAAMHASHVQHISSVWPWQAVGLMGVGAGSAPGTPTGGREMHAIARQKEREAIAATACSAFDKALQEERDGPSSGQAQQSRGRGGPWTRGPAPGVWKKMQPGSPSLPLRTPFSGVSEGTADRSRGAGRGQQVAGSSRGLSPMSPMSPTSAPLNRVESTASTIIQEFDRVVSTSTDIGEIYETVMQHACAGALVARAREVSRERERRDSTASGGGGAGYGYPRPGRLHNAPESQQSTASLLAGPRSLDSYGSGAGIPPRPPLPSGGASSITGGSEEGAPGLRSRGGAEPDSAFSGSVSTDAEPEDTPQVGGTDEISLITEQHHQQGPQRVTALTEIGQRRSSGAPLGRRMSDGASDGAGQSQSSTLDSSDAYFGVLPQQTEQPTHPAAAAHVARDPQAMVESAQGSMMSRSMSGDITPRLHGLPAAVSSEAPSPSTVPFQASAGGYMEASSAAEMGGAAQGGAGAPTRTEGGGDTHTRQGAGAPAEPGWRRAADAQHTFRSPSHTKRERSPRLQESLVPSSRLEARENVGMSQSRLAVTPLDMPTARSISFSNPSTSGTAPTPSFPAHSPNITTHSPSPIIDVTSSYHQSIDRPASEGGPQGEYPTSETPEVRRFLRSRGQTYSSQDTVSASQSTVHPSSLSDRYNTRGQPVSQQTGASSSASVQRPNTYYSRDSVSSGGGNPWSLGTAGRSQGREASSSTATVSQPSMADMAPQIASLTPGSGSTGSLSTAPTFAAGLPDQRSKHTMSGARRTGSIPSQDSEGRAPRSTASARGTSTETRSTAHGTDSLMDVHPIPSDMSISGALPDSAIAGATGATLANWVGSMHGLSDASRAPYSSKSRSFSHSMSQSLSTHSLSHSMTQSLQLPRFDSSGNGNGGPAVPSDTSSETPPLPKSSRSVDSLHPRHSGDLSSSESAQPSSYPPRTSAAAGAADSSAGTSSAQPELGSQGDSYRSVASRPLSGGGPPSQIPIRPGSDLARFASSKPPMQGRRGHTTGSRSLPGGDSGSGTRGRSMHGRSARRSRTSSASGASGGMSLRASAASTRTSAGSQPANPQSLSGEVLVPALQHLPQRHSTRGGRQAQHRRRMDELRESVRDQGQLDIASVSSGGGSTTFAVASSASGGLGGRGMMGSRTAAFVGDYQMSDRLEPTHQRSLIMPSQRAAEHWSRPADIRARTTSPRDHMVGASAPGVASGAPSASPGSPAATQGSQGSQSPRHNMFNTPADTPFMLQQHALGRRRPQAQNVSQMGQASQQARPGAPAQSSRDRFHSSRASPQRFQSSSQLVAPPPPPLTAVAVSDTGHSSRGRQRPSTAEQPRHAGHASEGRRTRERHGSRSAEASMTFGDGSHSTHSHSTSPHETSPTSAAASAWYGQPREDREAGFRTLHNQSSHVRGGPQGMQDAFQQRPHSRSGAKHSTQAAEPSERGSSMPGSGYQSPQGGLPAQQGGLPAWTRRSLSLSQSDVRLGDLEERVSRHTTAGTHGMTNTRLSHCLRVCSCTRAIHCPTCTPSCTAIPCESIPATTFVLAVLAA